MAALSACKPAASDQKIILEEDIKTSITLKAADRDGDPLTWSVGKPSHGELTGTPPT